MQANLRNVLVAVALIAPTPAAMADVITDWNEKVVDHVLSRNLGNAPGERLIGMVHTAMFDAINSIERRYRPYVVQLPASATASKEAAAAAAAGTIMAVLNQPTEGAVRGAMAAYLAAIPNSDGKVEGIKLGEAVAAKIIEARGNDGSEAADAYRPKTKPGVYIPTPITVSSTWANVKPFAMTSGSQFRPEPPISLQSEQWAAEYNEIKALGARNSTKRSAKQTEDARVWLATGPNAYYPIVRSLASAKKLGVLDNARLFALVSVGFNDGRIAIFDAKYHYDFWRPITAIRNGDLDDNTATERDAAWQPIADTPMHPEYPCAHCIAAGVLVGIAETLFGAEIPEVSGTSPTAPGVTHRWASMRAFADEVAAARIYAGFHYRFSTRVGQDMGLKLGEYVVKNVMQPAAVAVR